MTVRAKKSETKKKCVEAENENFEWKERWV